MTEDTACLICHRLTPRKLYVCDRDRQRESARLSEIVQLYAVLPAALDVNPNTVIDLTYPPVGGAAAKAVRRCERCARRGLPSWVIPCRHAQPDRDERVGDINVAAILDSWVRDWCETLHCPDPPKVPTVSRLAQWLQIWLPVACDNHPAIDEYAGEIRRLAATMRRAINRDTSPVRYEAPCPYCATRTLRREPGGDWIECVNVTERFDDDTQVDYEGCHRLWGEDEYAFLARAAIHPEQMLTTEEAAALAEVEPGTIRVWAHRGKLTAEYPEGGTKPWYRKGAVQEVAERMAT